MDELAAAGPDLDHGLDMDLAGLDPAEVRLWVDGVLAVSVHGEPQAYPQRRRGGTGPARHKPAWTKAQLAWRQAVERAAAEAVEAAGGPAGVSERQGLAPGEAVAVTLVFRFGTAEAAKRGKPHTAKPDSDNLVKLALDALCRAGVLWGDDARAAFVTVRKVWAARGGLLATVRRESETPAPDGQGGGWGGVGPCGW
jgi:hypothetical protein